MNNIQNKNSSFLGNKRKEEKAKQEAIYSKKEQINKEDLSLKVPLVKSEIGNNLINPKICINLEEKNEINNIIENIRTKNKAEAPFKICQICENNNNLVFFESYKNIIEYFSNHKIMVLFKSELSKKYENLKFEKQKIICSECLIEISKNQKDFENFINDNNNINESPFSNLLENSNLKIFNNKEKKAPDKFITNKIISEKMKLFNNMKSDEHTNLNNFQINNNGLFNHNLILEKLNAFNGPIPPNINYNFPFNPNIVNLNMPNYYDPSNDQINNINNIFNNKAKDFNNFNSNLLLPNQLLNYPYFFNNSSFGQQLLNTSLNHNFIPNINSQLSSLKNKNIFNEKINDINQNLNLKKEEKNSNDNNQKENTVFGNIYSNMDNYMNIPKQEFDEIFFLVSQLYYKLLNIKINRNSSSDINTSLNQMLSRTKQIQNLFHNLYLNNNTSNSDPSAINNFRNIADINKNINSNNIGTKEKIPVVNKNNENSGS